MEMVLADAAVQCNADADGMASTSSPSQDALPTGPRWQAFVASLTKMGYFQEQLPGSALYNTLLQQAHAAFTSTSDPPTTSQADTMLACAWRTLQSLPEVDASTWRALHPTLASADDDGWMRDGGPELDAELARRQAERDAHQTATEGASVSTRGPGASVEDVAGRIGAFVDGHGGVDGAQVPDVLEMGVDVSMDAVLRELSAALGVPLGKAGDVAGMDVASNGLDDDDGESEEEGSSFFSDPPTSDDEEDDDTAAVQQEEEEEAGPSHGVGGLGEGGQCVHVSSCV